MNQSNIYESLYLEWYKKEVKEFSKNKRKYAHFDPFINIKSRRSFFYKYFENSKNVVSHSFYPFIKTNLPKYKYIKDPRTGKRMRDRNSMVREICYASHFDSFIYSWYSTILSKHYEEKLMELNIDHVPLAYRKLNLANGKGKCNIHFAKEIFDYILDIGNCYVLALDFKSYFDKIDHLKLKENWSFVLNSSKLPEDHYKIYKLVTNYSFVKKCCLDVIFYPNVYKDFRICNPKDFREKVRAKGEIFKNLNVNDLEFSFRNDEQCGIPQGSPISAVLSNINLIQFDKKLHEYANLNDGYYRRYSDDLIYVSKKDDVKVVLEFIEDLVSFNELKLSQQKTEIVKFFSTDGNVKSFDYNTGLSKELQYLGFLFDGERTLIRSSSLARYHRKLRKGAEKVAKETLGQKSISNQPFLKTYYSRYTDVGSNNFITYAKKSASEIGSKKIKKQVKENIKNAKRVLVKKIAKREEMKGKEGKVIVNKLKT